VQHERGFKRMGHLSGRAGAERQLCLVSLRTQRGPGSCFPTTRLSRHAPMHSVGHGPQVRTRKNVGVRSMVRLMCCSLEGLRWSFGRPVNVTRA
jgi:hypothetical protein